MLDGLVSRVAPDGVASAQMEDSGQTIAIPDEEAVLVAGAAEQRRRDFVLGRACAHTALAQLGAAPAVILRGADGGPLWPAQIVGSITHTHGYAAALVAEKSRFQGIGVDAERAGRVTEKLFRLLFNAMEQARLEKLDAEQRKFAATILFSAKEAYYKARNPLTGTKLSFPQIQIELEDDSFIASQPGEISREAVRGRFAIGGDLVVTSVCLPK